MCIRDSNIHVWHCCWKSLKKIGFVNIINPETGMPEEYQVNETYKETGNELDVEWKWIIEVWEGYRIGQDLSLIHISYKQLLNPKTYFLTVLDLGLVFH